MKADMAYFSNRALKKLEGLEKQIEKTEKQMKRIHGLKMLGELIKEQNPYENSRRTAHPTR
jgi:hypothetical protein